MRALAELKKWKGVFGVEAAGRVEELLTQLLRARAKSAGELIELHETVLFLRAYPQSPQVVELAEQILASFGGRLRGVDLGELEDPEVSGTAETSVSSNFSYEFARSLVTRHERQVGIDWENFERPHLLGPVLTRLLPAAAEAWTVEPHIDWRAWMEAVGFSLRALIKRVEPRVYDLLEIPIKWELGESSASRTKLRLPRKSIFYHEQMLRRRDVSIEGEFAAAPIVARRVPKREAQRVVDVILDSSASRYRELWGFSFPDLDYFYRADFGRGVEFYFFGVPKDRRLPLRAYHCGMYFKNGVPIGYFEGLSLFERMEAGFNLYYTFRDGETAWLYARTLKLWRECLGVTCFSIDPYQVGHENEEAIESGAFWFYRKLGFRPALAHEARLAESEEKELAANPEYRTPPSTLRMLARSPMLYGGDDAWGCFSIQRLAKNLDRRGKDVWKMLRSPVARRAKGSPEETEYLRVLQSLPTLRGKVLALGRL